MHFHGGVRRVGRGNILGLSGGYHRLPGWGQMEGRFLGPRYLDYCFGCWVGGGLVVVLVGSGVVGGGFVFSEVQGRCLGRRRHPGHSLRI